MRAEQFIKQNVNVEIPKIAGQEVLPMPAIIKLMEEFGCDAYMAGEDNFRTRKPRTAREIAESRIDYFTSFLKK